MCSCSVGSRAATPRGKPPNLGVLRASGLRARVVSLVRRLLPAQIGLTTALLLAATGAAAPVQAQAAPVCGVSGPASGAYQATVCLTAPDDGSTLTGDAPVSATVTVTGANPGVRQVQFDLDDEYLLTDFEAPFSFSLPSDKWANGARRLQVHAIMKDDFVSDGVSIDVAFDNGSTAPVTNPRRFTPTSGTDPPPGKPFVMAAVGDGGNGEINANSVADRIASWDPTSSCTSATSTTRAASLSSPTGAPSTSTS